MVVFLSASTPKRAAGTGYTDAERIDITTGLSVLMQALTVLRAIR
jgi:hypothetical protein